MRWLQLLALLCFVLHCIALLRFALLCLAWLGLLPFGKEVAQTLQRVSQHVEGLRLGNGAESDLARWAVGDALPRRRPPQIERYPEGQLRKDSPFRQMQQRSH